MLTRLKMEDEQRKWAIESVKKNCGGKDVEMEK